MNEITGRQAQILIHIENYIQENGYSPTIRAIAGHCKMSPKGAHNHVIALVNKGCLICQTGRARTIRIKAKKQGANP
jgi:repressor LexA